MAYVRTFTSKRGYKYRALVESYRDVKGRPRQRMLKWLGPVHPLFSRGTTSGDIGGGIALGLPFRIVYDLVSGNRLEALKERLARLAFVPPEERRAATSSATPSMGCRSVQARRQRFRRRDGRPRRR